MPPPTEINAWLQKLSDQYRLAAGTVHRNDGKSPCSGTVADRFSQAMGRLDVCLESVTALLRDAGGAERLAGMAGRVTPDIRSIRIGAEKRAADLTELAGTVVDQAKQ